MKALVKTGIGPESLMLKEVPKPVPSAGEVQIKVEAAGICGTDIHIYRDNYPCTPPVILGHEVSGVIAEVGSGVVGIIKGDRVTCESHAITCGICYYCRTGLEKLCADRKALGREADGGFAEFIKIKSSLVHKLPDNVNFSEGALTQLVACAYHAVSERTCVKAGDIVVVFGPGATGLLTAQVAKAEGAFVIVVGTTRGKARLELASQLGADIVVNGDDEDVVKIIHSVSNGYGADLVFECSGATSAVEKSLECVKKNGKVIQMGWLSDTINFDLNIIAKKNLTIIGSVGYTWLAWENSIKLLKHNKVNLKPLISMELPLADWAQGFEFYEQRKGIRTILKP